MNTEHSKTSLLKEVQEKVIPACEKATGKIFNQQKVDWEKWFSGCLASTLLPSLHR